MRRAVVVANSDLPPHDVLRPYLEAADVVVAADGGANRLLALGIEPDAAVGDFDSLLGSTRRRLGAARLHERAEPDRTDLEKAIEFAVESGATDVTVAGASVGRLDHVLGAVAVLLDWSDRVAIRLLDADFVTERVRDRASFRAPIGTLVSLFSPTVAHGVTTQGLRWALRDATLPRGTLGVHNEVASNPVTVRVRSGELLLHRGHRVEPHR
jgi:thiamine pyrophosphokinase